MPDFVPCCCTLSSVEKRANSTVGLFVTVPGSLTRKAYDTACQRLANDRKVTIPGFRKGQKVPEQVLLNAVGGPAVIINEALDVLCEDALKTAIDDSDIKAVGQVKNLNSVVTKKGALTNRSCMYTMMTFWHTYTGPIDFSSRDFDWFIQARRTHYHGTDGWCLPWCEVHGRLQGPQGEFDEIIKRESSAGIDDDANVPYWWYVLSGQVTVDRIPLEDDKVKAAMEALRKKRVKLVGTDAGYQAKLGDSAIVNMRVS